MAVSSAQRAQALALAREGDNQLVVEGVSKKFGGVTAVSDVSVDVPRGGILSIIGPNGAGKTSLLNMISGFYKPDTGRIFVAREGAGIAGTVSLLFTVSTALGGPVCWLEDMGVRPDARGRGVGGLLIEHAIAFARAEGYTRLTLTTDGDNAAARRFYERHGYANHENGQDEPMLYYFRELAP